MSSLRRAKKLPYTMYLKRQKNLMNKAKGFILTPLEIMKNSMHIIKKKVRVIRKSKKELEKHLPYRKNKKYSFHEFGQLKLDRSLKNVYRQYMRLTKNELATRLIEAEQYIAEGKQEYLKKLFETYEG